MTAWTTIQPGLRVKLRHDQYGRKVVCGIELTADAIYSRDLREVPLAAIEAEANGVNPEGWPAAPGRKVVTPRTKPIGLLPLVRDGHSPDEFSRLVADHFKAWAALCYSPVAVMSAEYGINPRTMHSWIREARLRGHLPPARGHRNTKG